MLVFCVLISPTFVFPQSTLGLTVTPELVKIDEIYTFIIEENSTQTYIVDFQPEQSRYFNKDNESYRFVLELTYEYRPIDRLEDRLRNTSLYAIFNESLPFSIGDDMSSYGYGGRTHVGVVQDPIHQSLNLLNYSHSVFYTLWRFNYPLLARQDSDPTPLDTAGTMKLVFDNTDNSVAENVTIRSRWILDDLTGGGVILDPIGTGQNKGYIDAIVIGGGFLLGVLVLLTYKLYRSIDQERKKNFDSRMYPDHPSIRNQAKRE